MSTVAVWRSGKERGAGERVRVGEGGIGGYLTRDSICFLETGKKGLVLEAGTYRKDRVGTDIVGLARASCRRWRGGA